MKKPANADQLAMQAVPYVNGTELKTLTEEQRQAQYDHSILVQDPVTYAHGYTKGYASGYENGRDAGAWADLY